MDSKQLQDLSQGTLQQCNTPLTQEVLAMRGIGYAVLALLQFLRESEREQVAAKKEFPIVSSAQWEKFGKEYIESVYGQTQNMCHCGCYGDTCDCHNRDSEE